MKQGEIDLRVNSTLDFGLAGVLGAIAGHATATGHTFTATILFCTIAFGILKRAFG